MCPKFLRRLGLFDDKSTISLSKVEWHHYLSVNVQPHFDSIQQVESFSHIDSVVTKSKGPYISYTKMDLNGRGGQFREGHVGCSECRASRADGLGWKLLYIARGFTWRSIDTRISGRRRSGLYWRAMDTRSRSLRVSRKVDSLGYRTESLVRRLEGWIYHENASLAVIIFFFLLLPAMKRAVVTRMTDLLRARKAGSARSSYWRGLRVRVRVCV